MGSDPSLLQWVLVGQTLTARPDPSLFSLSGGQFLQGGFAEMLSTRFHLRKGRLRDPHPYGDFCLRKSQVFPPGVDKGISLLDRQADYLVGYCVAFGEANGFRKQARVFIFFE